MLEKDWMVSKIAIMYPNTIKVFQQYQIDVECCYGDGHMTLEQVALKLNIGIEDLLEIIKKNTQT